MAADETDWLQAKGGGWTVRGLQRVHDNPWFAVEDYDVVAPTGAPARYYVLRYKNVAVGALPLHEDGTVTFVGQQRFPHGRYSWELPEGGSPMAEDPLEGAKRELREEAGLEARDWRHVLTMQLSNASSDEVALGYVAMGFTPVPKSPDATEQLAITRAPFREALAAAVSGKIQDSITMAMLLRLYHMAHEGELPEVLARAVLG